MILEIIMLSIFVHASNGGVQIMKRDRQKEVEQLQKVLKTVGFTQVIWRKKIKTDLSIW